MDTDTQQLERAVERDPSDYEAILRLAQNYERMAWTHKGRSPREWMKDLENPHLRWGVAEALESAGPVFIPALVETLTHERPAVRWRAATMLSRIRPHGLSALPFLIRQLGDASDFVREKVSQAIHILTGDPRDSLLQALYSDEPDIQRGAVTTLVSFPPRDSSSVPRLLELTQAKDSQTRRDAVRVLGRMGSLAKEAVPQLRELFELSSLVRVYAREAVDLIETGG